MGNETEGRRLYAIGDIHGCLDLLDDMLERIRCDLFARPHPAPSVIFLGDYVDRGPDTRGVLDRLIELEGGDLAPVNLLGNHDSNALASLHDPEWLDRPFHWFDGNMGGAETLRSYGVVDAHPLDPAGAHADFAAAFPAAHRAFLHRARLMVGIGSYLFVHAGIRPGVPLDAQRREDLIWIREPFLSDRRDHGAMVVHGHTIVPRVERWPNRIAVDTGAIRTGILSCVVLEGSRIDLLTPSGPQPLPEIPSSPLTRLGAALGLDTRRR